MEYENLDEATRREACEKVKQIAKAIEKIRKKYYLCFNKISDTDKQRYDEYKIQMQNIANENGFNKLSAELINDIDRQYNEEIPNSTDENGNLDNNGMEKGYQQFLKAIQVLTEYMTLLRKTTDPKLDIAYMKRIKKVQEFIKKLETNLEKSYSKYDLILAKRKGFSEMITKQSREDYENLMRKFYKIVDIEKICESANVIGEQLDNTIEKLGNKRQEGKEVEPLFG